MDLKDVHLNHTSHLEQHVSPKEEETVLVLPHQQSKLLQIAVDVCRFENIISIQASREPQNIDVTFDPSSGNRSRTVW
jgi:hypothetical protein